MDKKMVVRHSENLGEDLVVNVYGNAGQPIVAFPTQGLPPESLEEVGLVDELEDYLDAGVIQLFCASNVDNESWGGTGDPAARAARQEAYYQAVCDELVPLVHEVSGSDARPLALGFDLGATHAAIFALRRPDLFQGCMCLSGIYDSRRYFGDWMDATLYDNVPCAFLPNMTPDHPYVAVYNQRQLLFCSGQEASEGESLRTTREIDANLVRLGVEAWCDYWGGDVSHTWFWWKKQIRYFLPIVLEDVEKTTAAEKASVKKKAPARKRTTVRKTAAAKKPAAKKAEKDVKADEAPAKAAEKDAKAEAVAPAAKKAAPAAKAEPAEKAPAKKPAAKRAATKAKAAAEKPAEEKKTTTTAASAETPAAIAKAEKPAAPAKAVKAKVPAKTTAAKTTKPAAAKTSKTAAKAADAEKPAAKAAPAKKTAAKPAAKSTAAKATAAKPAAKPAATKRAAKGGTDAK